MKRFLVLTVCLALSGALVANATPITINDTDTGGKFSNGVTSDPLAGSAFGTIESVRTAAGGTDPLGNVNSTSFDELNLFLTGFNGPVNGYYANSIGGTFTASTGSTLQLVSSASAWKGQTTNGIVNLTTSFINFDTLVGTPTRGTQSSGSSYAWFTGNWGTTSNNYVQPSGAVPAAINGNTGYPSNLLAELFITPNGDVSFAGQLGTTYAGGAGVPNITFATTATPEPGALSLLGCAMLVLVAVAWRKRKLQQKGSFSFQG
jgi:hypothetical protein